jgi:hypothetical protein
MARMVKTQAVVGFDVDEKELRSKVSETCDVCEDKTHRSFAPTIQNKGGPAAGLDSL